MTRLLLFLTAALPLQLFASTAQQIASGYAAYAVEHNPNLRAQRLTIDIARTDRKSAFGAFLPTIDLQSRHFWADGGRDIVFDVNEFLPPEVLPVDIPETVVPFLRTREQETKVTVKQPLFAGGGILYGYRATRKAEQASRAEYAAAASELARTVRKVYYQYLQAREMTLIDGRQQDLAAEQLRVTRALFEVDKATLGDLRRAEAGFAAAEAKLISAQTQESSAGRGVNLLLGRDLDAEIELPADTAIDESILQLELNAEESRPEMRQIDLSIDALTEQKRATRSRFLPMVSAAFEYGYQGEQYDLDRDADYYLLSGVLSWNLFEGFRGSLSRQKVELARRQVEDRREWLRSSIRNEVQTARLTIDGKRSEHTAARRALDAAEESYRLVELRFREGMGSQLELTDAQTMLARAAANELLARYGYLIALADYRYSLGLPLEETNP